jgi:hypothetical protein
MGMLAGGWVGPWLHVQVVAEAPIEAIKMHGYLPYQRERGVRFSVSANEVSTEHIETCPGTFAWSIPCVAEAGQQIILSITAEQPYVPAEHGSPDRRKLGFILKEIEFRSPALSRPLELAPDTTTVRICPDPVIVVGSPRSGTTALAESLAQHSQLTTGPESDLLCAMFGQGRLDQIFEVATGQPHQLLSLEHVDEEQFQRWAVLGLNALLTARSGGKRWVEQSPSNTAVMRQIASAIPGARFVHILRDGRRVVHSMTHSGFYRPWATDFALACTAWRNFAQGALRFTEAHRARCIMVANEELSRDPQTGFRTIFAFLGLDDEPAPAEYFRTTRVGSSFARTTPPSSEPWLEWSAEQQQIFRDIAGPLLDELYSRGLLIEASARPPADEPNRPSPVRR